MNKSKVFTRNKEDFTCENCGVLVIGNGYTNHCPKCLWAKHVDINPGDRANVCKGMMEPYRIEGGTGKPYRILHKCTVCGFEKMNKVSPEDDVDAVLKVIGARAKEILPII